VKWKSVITILLLSIFLISSTGIVVYEHHCSKSGDFLGFYTGIDHDCNEEVLEKSCHKEEPTNCCNEKVVTDLPSVDENCCSTDVSLIQIESDYSTAFQDVEFEKGYVLSVSHYFNYKALKINKEKIIRGPPDQPISQSRKRASLQSYLI
jgi:hypothetical protein